MATPSATDVIRLLGLKPHPEGGHFRETFRDAETDAAGRAVSTARLNWLVTTWPTGICSLRIASPICRASARP